MSEKPYTPTTEHVRDLALRLMNAAEFDAWLAKVKADAWDEGYRAGADDMSDLRAGRLAFQTITGNPYRQEATR